MTNLAWFDTAFCTRILLTLGHFLWQGAAIALAAFVLSVVLRNSSARLRYVCFLAALLLMTICPVVTFWFVQGAESRPALAQSGEPILTSETDTLTSVLDEIAAATKVPAGNSDVLTSVSDEIPAVETQSLHIRSSSSEPAILEAVAGNSATNDGAQAESRWQWAVPFLTAAYLVGVILLLGRLLVGLHGGRHLRRKSQLIDEPELLSVIARKVEALGMRFTPTVLYCKQVAVPTVVGVFRPAILLPLSLTTGLSPDQVEAVLTHELAHIRRYDHLFNLLQRVVEALLFFHPAVWWVSHRIRVERENCCDDIVVAFGADRLQYAASLVDIAERGRESRLSPHLETVAALHAAKSGSLLGQRIRRLVSGSSSETLRLTRGGVAGLLLTICLLAVVWQVAAVRTVADTGDSGEDRREVNAGESKSQEVSDAEPKTAGPRTVVAKWMELVRADNIRDSWALTTKSVDLDAQDDLKRLWNKDKIRIERSLGNESAAVVVTNTVKDNSGRDRAFAFWVVRRDGVWLINVSYIDDPEDIEQQLRGFFAGGNVNWHVKTEDIVGTWSAGLGFAFGLQYQFEDKGTFTRQMWDSGGKLTVKHGTWRLEKDRLIREQDEHRIVSRVFWLRKDFFQLESSDGKSRTGYRRKKVEENRSGRTRNDASEAEESAASAAVRKRSFVCLVVGRDGLTFEGSATTWDEIDDLIRKIPNRKRTVLEFAVASNDFTIAEVNATTQRCSLLARKHGFEYPSYTGVKKLGATGSTTQDLTADGKEVPLKWGEPNRGVRVRLQTDQVVWPLGGMPKLSAEIRNDGQLALQVAQAQQLCELKVDEQWYIWGGSIDVKSSALPPGRHYRGIPVTLDQWREKGGTKSLKLSLGKHKIRIVFLPDATKPVGEEPKPIRVVSNAIEIEILDPTSKGGQAQSSMRTIDQSGEELSVAISSDGKLLAGGRGDKTAKLWDAQTGKLIWTSPKQGDIVMGVAISPDNKILATTESNTVKLWDLRTRRVKQTLRTGEDDGVQLTSIAFSPDGKKLVAGGDWPDLIWYAPGGLWLWDVESGRLEKELAHERAVALTRITFSPGGRFFASGSQGNSAMIWDAKTWKVKHSLRFTDPRRNQEGAGLVAFSPSGKMLATGGSVKDRTFVRVYDTQTGKPLWVSDADVTAQPTEIKFSSDGSTLLGAGQDKKLRFWNANTGKMKRMVSLPPQAESVKAFSPDARILVFVTDDDQGTLRLVSIEELY